jgi:hypothetical protein
MALIKEWDRKFPRTSTNLFFLEKKESKKKLQLLQRKIGGTMVESKPPSHEKNASQKQTLKGSNYGK